MTEGWTFAGEPTRVSGATVTLLEGSSFCLCEQSGDINLGSPQGLFFRDTRILSGWQLLLDDEAVEPLAVIAEAPRVGSPRCAGRSATRIRRRFGCVR